MICNILIQIQSLWRAVVAFSNRILLPEGSRGRSLGPGWEGSPRIFLALLSALSGGKGQITSSLQYLSMSVRGLFFTWGI